MSVSYAHLLIVDSDEERRQSLRQPLHERQWYTISMAADVETALATLRQEPIDVVLVEVGLAIADEQHFLRSARLVDPDHPLKILLIAPAGDDAAVKAGLAAGANDWIYYPADPSLLKARCELAVQQIYLQQQLRSTAQSFQEVMQLAENLRETIIPLSISLAAETEFDRLIERFLHEAKAVTQADAGALFLVSPENQLRLVLAQYDSLELDWTTGQETGYPYATIPLSLTDNGPTSPPDIVASAALTGQTLNISQIKKEEKYSFALLEAFDSSYGYETISLLVVPLRNEHLQGVLLLINAREPKSGRVGPFSRHHVLVADSLAAQAGVLLHNHVLRERSVKLQTLQEELRIGREIQMGFFPAELPQPAGWNIAAHLRPARDVCGDFYDLFPLPNHKLGFIVADVCDKGVGAALFMSLIRTLFRAFMQQFFESDPSQTVPPPDDEQVLLQSVTFTNHYIVNNHGQDHMFATLFLGLLDPSTGEILYVNAGHEPPLLRTSSTNAIQRLTRGGPAVGLAKEAVYHVQRAHLAPGDWLVIYTDGVVEARDPTGTPFTAQRLEQILTASPETAQQLILEIDQQVTEHTQKAEPGDDVTLVTIQRQK